MRRKTSTSAGLDEDDAGMTVFSRMLQAPYK
ncbi:hypothetical protein RS9916_27984 [Synechococcus sp. RS9916]|nr:hypothetical protein RS9916_27984 [Synechococcus sp. RS9916]